MSTRMSTNGLRKNWALSCGLVRRLGVLGSRPVLDENFKFYLGIKTELRPGKGGSAIGTISDHQSLLSDLKSSGPRAAAGQAKHVVRSYDVSLLHGVRL